MAVIGKDTKQPKEIDSWDVDYGDWLPRGDGIDFVTVEVRLLSGPTETPVEVASIDSTESMTKVTLKSGAHGAKYRIEVSAATIGGLLKEAEFDITVKEV